MQKIFTILKEYKESTQNRRLFKSRYFLSQIDIT